MLTIHINDVEFYDEIKDEFVNIKGQTIQLEHSLVSLSKWESKWLKPYFSKVEKTDDETIDYIRCMTITQNVNDSLYKYINQDVLSKISEYINHPMTATTISKNKSVNKEIITAEIIYYSMMRLTIPMECQKWHINRLLTLISVFAIKDDPKSGKTNSQTNMQKRRELNNARKQSLNTNG